MWGTLPAVNPFLGQVNCAVEDCLELNHLLQEKDGDLAEVWPAQGCRWRPNVTSNLASNPPPPAPEGSTSRAA